MSKVTETILNQVESLTDQAAGALGLEVVEVELKGSGSQRFIRVTIDKLGSEVKGGGVTHTECEELSRTLSALLDEHDAVPGEEPYTLEVTSPGVDRKLLKLQDFVRFQGHQAKIRFREAVQGQRTWIGTLSGVDGGQILLEAGPGQTIRFSLEQVSQANLKYVW
jgi:ribosome maturation factor RimP